MIYKNKSRVVGYEEPIFPTIKETLSDSEYDYLETIKNKILKIMQVRHIFERYEFQNNEVKIVAWTRDRLSVFTPFEFVNYIRDLHFLLTDQEIFNENLMHLCNHLSYSYRDNFLGKIRGSGLENEMQKAANTITISGGRKSVVLTDPIEIRDTHIDDKSLVALNDISEEDLISGFETLKNGYTSIHRSGYGFKDMLNKIIPDKKTQKYLQKTMAKPLMGCYFNRLVVLTPAEDDEMNGIDFFMDLMRRTFGSEINRELSPNYVMGHKSNTKGKGFSDDYLTSPYYMEDLGKARYLSFRGQAIESKGWRRHLLEMCEGSSNSGLNKSGKVFALPIVATYGYPPSEECDWWFQNTIDIIKVGYHKDYSMWESDCMQPMMAEMLAWVLMGISLKEEISYDARIKTGRPSAVLKDTEKYFRGK